MRTLFLLFLGAAPLFAQAPNKFTDVGSFSARIEPPQAKPGQVVEFVLTITPKPKYWTYPADAPAGQVGRNKLKFPDRGEFLFGPVTDPPKAKSKANPNNQFDLYYEGPTTWRLPLLVLPTATPGAKTVTLAVGTSLSICGDDGCFYTSKNTPPSAAFEVLAGPAEPLTPEWTARLAERKPVETPVPTLATAEGDAAKALDAIRRQLQFAEGTSTSPVSRSAGLLTFLGTAMLWGWISLLTPCVFPMVPITVSLFLKQSAASARRALTLSLVYSLTIILVLGLSAYALLSVFRKLSVDPYMNIFLGMLFFVFALSLLGLFDIALPGFLLRAAEKRRASGGMIGTVFGAVAFSIVSFTCVAPFLGGFAGMAASGGFAPWELILGALAFATAFASPFFVLALFPSLMKQLPRSGGWLDTVKALMGFLELAAALKFFRTAELRLLPTAEFFTYDVVLAGWVAVFGCAALYLLGFFKLPHDEPEAKPVAVPKVMLALVLVGFSVYLLPGLWKNGAKPQRPGGVVFAWVDSFLLPEAGTELPFTGDLPAALAQAQSRGGRVLIDFTGKTCTNCKLNEQQIFPRPEIAEALKSLQLVQLYTDEVPAEFYARATTTAERDAAAAANLEFQKAAFGTEQLPLYVILE
ncbi:MAG: protein-disulfide reductase DsbD family protein, partial [Gemmataceae bacterium]